MVGRVACMVGGGGHVWQGTCVVGGHVCQGGMRGRGTCVAGGMHGVGGHAWQGEYAWQGAFMAGGMRGMHACRPPTDTTKYGDTVNEQAVRILLECILVFYSFR